MRDPPSSDRARSDLAARTILMKLLPPTSATHPLSRMGGVNFPTESGRMGAHNNAAEGGGGVLTGSGSCEREGGGGGDKGGGSLMTNSFLRSSILKSGSLTPTNFQSSIIKIYPVSNLCDYYFLRSSRSHNCRTALTART
jgi:hypothetical protein